MVREPWQVKKWTHRARKGCSSTGDLEAVRASQGVTCCQGRVLNCPVVTDSVVKVVNVVKKSALQTRLFSKLCAAQG